MPDGLQIIDGQNATIQAEEDSGVFYNVILIDIIAQIFSTSLIRPSQYADINPLIECSNGRMRQRRRRQNH